MINYTVKSITYNDTKPFILDIHYAKRMPSISYAYGLFYKNELTGIVSYGSPVSPALCKGVATFRIDTNIMHRANLMISAG